MITLKFLKIEGNMNIGLVWKEHEHDEANNEVRLGGCGCGCLALRTMSGTESKSVESVIYGVESEQVPGIYPTIDEGQSLIITIDRTSGTIILSND